MEKVERTQIHHTIKEIFSHVTSSTVDKDDKKFIKVSKQDRKSKLLRTTFTSLSISIFWKIKFKNF